MNRIWKSILLTLLISGVLFSGCSDDVTDDPKRVVIAMFGAMEKNDKPALARLLDMGELMRESNEDYATQTDKPRHFVGPEELLNDLTDEGKTKKTWFGLQRIVNKARVTGETATVEVTFVDKKNSKGYRTTFGLKRNEGRWRIYSFKTLEESP